MLWVLRTEGCRGRVWGTWAIRGLGYRVWGTWAIRGVGVQGTHRVVCQVGVTIVTEVPARSFQIEHTNI